MRLDFVENCKHIEACQWVQEHKGELTMRIVRAKEFTQEDELHARQQILNRLGADNIDLKIDYKEISDLEYTKHGKFKLIINKTNL